MRVESADQGVRFEWNGEPDTVVKVGLMGSHGQNEERLTVLLETIQSQRHGGIEWTDLELRTRTFTKGSDGWKRIGGGKELLLWSGQFSTWQEAGVAFAVLCKAVGMEDDGVALEVEM